jgi:hypothetical protein
MRDEDARQTTIFDNFVTVDKTRMRILNIDNKHISTKYTRSMNINEWNNSTGNFTWNGQNGNLVI